MVVAGFGRVSVWLSVERDISDAIQGVNTGQILRHDGNTSKAKSRAVITVETSVFDEWYRLRDLTKLAVFCQKVKLLSLKSDCLVRFYLVTSKTARLKAHRSTEILSKIKFNPYSNLPGRDGLTQIRQLLSHLTTAHNRYAISTSPICLSDDTCLNSCRAGHNGYTA